MKKPPIGTSDYKKIIESGSSYADKTLLIQEILGSGVEVSLIPRPRRFGKTTNLSMLYYFFSNREGDNTHLFNQFKIWDPACLDRLGKPAKEQMGRFPVVFFSLKGVEHADWSSAYQEIKSCLSKVFEKWQFLLDIFDPIVKERKFLSEHEASLFQSVIDGSASEAVFVTSLERLIHLLERYYQKRVIVLIDEYDAPIHAAYLHGYYEQMLLFMRKFFGAALKDNSSLEKAVLTGILRVSKESIFSGFNNGICYTLLDNAFADKFGLLEEEVMALFAECGEPLSLEEIRKWYNGYLVGGYSLYNPWSIIQCIQNKGKLGTYWVNTSSNELIKKLLWGGSASLKKDMERLIQGESVLKAIQPGIIFSELERQEDAIWSLFFFSGYLTLDKESPNSWNPDRLLRIPNEEVSLLFRTMMQHWLKENLPKDNVADLLSSLVQGDVEAFSVLFQSLVLRAMSSHDFPEESAESVYHAFILGLLVYLENTHEVKSNRESGYGRDDVCLIPKNPQELGIVMEFKKGKKGQSLAKIAGEALLQIEEKQYAEELKSRGINRVLSLGIAFQAKKILVKSV